jgi:hypothetical protein
MIFGYNVMTGVNTPGFTRERISGNSLTLERRNMGVAGVLDVAKKKTEKPEAKPATQAAFGPGKAIAIQVRGSAEFKAWVEGLAEFDATGVSDVVERALASYARSIHFATPLPKR